jgi:hypothetical protein
MAVRCVRAASLILLLALAAGHAGAAAVALDCAACCPGMAEGGSESPHPCTAMGPASCCEMSVPLPSHDAGVPPAPPAAAQLLLPAAQPALHLVPRLPALVASRLASRSVVLRL